MTPTTSADRRRVLRRTVECAIGLDSTTRNGQAGALTATVWRVIEPALAQRDQQLDAVRDVIADMEGDANAQAWARRLRKASDVKNPPTEVAPVAVNDRTLPVLTVTFIPELRRVSVCESGRHGHHAGQTCAEVDAEPSIETLIGEGLKAMGFNTTLEG